MGREVLESSSPRFQRGAIPSQLPTRKTNKKARRSLVNTGLLLSREVEFGQVSQAQRIYGERIRRLTGEILSVQAFGDTWSQRSHDALSNPLFVSCMGRRLALRDKRRIWFQEGSPKKSAIQILDAIIGHFIPKRS